MKKICSMMLLAMLIMSGVCLASVSQKDDQRELVQMMIGKDGVHPGSVEIVDWNTSVPVYIVGASKILPYGISGPEEKSKIHGLNIVLSLPSQSDVEIAFNSSVDSVDEGNRTDDIKVSFNDAFVGYWNPYSGKEKSVENISAYRIPAKYTRAGLNNLLLSMEHLPEDVWTAYSFHRLDIKSASGTQVIGMEDPDFGWGFGISVPTYNIGDPASKFPLGIVSPGYNGSVHGVNIKFNLSDVSDVSVKMNCWGWKDKNNRTDDFKVLMNGNLVGYWNPYDGKQYFGNRTFSYEIPAKYTKTGANELTLSMEHLPDIKYTWYRIYWMELDVEQPKD